MYVTPVRSDELYHWVPFKRRTRQNHKYIAKVGNGKDARYFYTQAEYDAYKHLTGNISKTRDDSIIGKAKGFIDYRITGQGYRRDAKEFGEKMDRIARLKNRESLTVDRNKFNQEEKDIRGIGKNKSSDLDKNKRLKEQFNSKRGKEIGDQIRELNDKRHNEQKLIDNANEHAQNVARVAKQRKLDQAEEDFRNKSLVGRVVKTKEGIDKLIDKRNDNKTTKFMKNNQEFAKQWMRDLNISKKEYNPSKQDTNKLKRVLRKKGLLRKDETLNEFLERSGYMTKGKGGKVTYYKKKQIKHSDFDTDAIYSAIADSEELYHYGRRGMKWYQHIFGPVQAGAQYAKKAGAKLAERKEAKEEKKAAKWEATKEKIIRSGNADKVRKIEKQLTDEELKRANNRIKEHSTLNPQQGKQFVDKQKDKSAFDLLNDYAKIAKTISDTYSSTEKIMKTIEDAKKYTPEGRAKAEAKKAWEKEADRIVREQDIAAYQSNKSSLDSKRIEQLSKALTADANIEIRRQAIAKRALDEQKRLKPWITDMGPMPIKKIVYDHEKNKQIVEEHLPEYINAIYEEQRKD